MSIGSELNISNIKAGFEADKDSSVIFNSTEYLVASDKIIAEEGVYKLEKLVDGYNVNLTDEETMISAKPAKRLKRLKESFRQILQSFRHDVAALRSLECRSCLH